MAESTMILYPFKELAEMMVREQGIKEGYWGIYVKFGITAANAGPTPTDIKPTAIVPILEIGLQKFEELNNLSVDAAEVSAAPKGAKKSVKELLTKKSGGKKQQR